MTGSAQIVVDNPKKWWYTWHIDSKEILEIRAACSDAEPCRGGKMHEGR